MNSLLHEIRPAASAIQKKISEAGEDACCLMIIGTDTACLSLIHSDGHILAQAIAASCADNPKLFEMLKHVVKLMDSGTADHNTMDEFHN